MATPRKYGHAHHHTATPTSSILKRVRKSPPTSASGQGKKVVRFSEGPSPQPNQQQRAVGNGGQDEGGGRKAKGGKKSTGAGRQPAIMEEGGVGKGGRKKMAELAEEEYEVEAILGHRKVKRREIEYLIKWKGYPNSDSTWVPLSQMSCEDRVQDYHRRKQRPAQPTPCPSPSDPPACQSRSGPVTSKESPPNRHVIKKKPSRASAGVATERRKEQPLKSTEPEEKEYEVEAIIDHRKPKDHKELEYLVRWKGSPSNGNSWLRPGRIPWTILEGYIRTKIFKKPSKVLTTLQPPVSNRTASRRSTPTVDRPAPQAEKEAPVHKAKLPSPKLQKPGQLKLKPAQVNGLSIPAVSVNGATSHSTIVYIDHTVLDSPPPSPTSLDQSPVRLAPSPRLSPLCYRLPSARSPSIHLTPWVSAVAVSPVTRTDLSPSSSSDDLASPSANNSIEVLSDSSPGFQLTLELDTEEEEEESPLLGSMCTCHHRSPSVIVIDSPPDSDPPPPPLPVQPPNGIVRQNNSKPSFSNRHHSETPSPRRNGFKHSVLLPGTGSLLSLSKKVEDNLMERLAVQRQGDKPVTELKVRVEHRLLVNRVIRLPNGTLYRSPLSPHNPNSVDKRVVSLRSNRENGEAWSLSRLRKRSRSVSPLPTRCVQKRRCSPRLSNVLPALDNHRAAASVMPEHSQQQEVAPLPVTIPLPPLLPPPLQSVTTNQERYQDQLLEWQYLLNKQRRGLEEIILVENTVDEAPIPNHFHYITSNIYSHGVPDPSSNNEILTGCACYLLHKKCGPKAGHCCPHQAGAEFGYSLAGKVKLSPGKPIYECNRNCSCRPDCNNRVVQHGRQLPLCIFRTVDGRGWGVKTVEAIKPNTFIAEYVGEVLTTEEAERRGRQYDREGSTYLFDLDFNEDPAFTIDAAKYGNVSHFFNHSCDPNLVVYSVWIDTLDPRLPRIAFFTTRNVSAGEELTFDYQMNHNQNMTRKTTGHVPCLCRSPNCIGYLD